MRQIGQVDSESNARSFADYLYVQGIENQIEQQKDDRWAVWINDEDKIDRAKELLTSFIANPVDPKYEAESRKAARLRQEKEKNEAAYRKKVRDRGQVFRPMTQYGFGPLTLVLIAISVGVFIFSRFGADLNAVRALLISEFAENHRDFSSMLLEVRHGQIWRLITPVFLHFSVLHIFFNMLWLRDLGGMIEGRQGPLQLGLLVVVIAACSNFGQYYVSGPIFGGMSGVVYGLLGYIWLRGKYDPGSGLFLHPSTVTMMLIWFALCYTNLFGTVQIANTTHAVGLVMGVAWGYLSSLRYR